MGITSEITALQACVRNRLDTTALGANKIAGVIGGAPSAYSKSPALWNAVFRALQLDVTYVALDVDDAQLGNLFRVLRSSPRFLGVNVTVPHKIRVIPHLDELDEESERIGAVNTVVRTPAGKLSGYNTDGRGFRASLLETLPGQKQPFLATMDGINALLIGAGGAARAVAFALAEGQHRGRVIICNRTHEPAAALARDLEKAGANAICIDESEIGAWAPRVDLIVNTSVKGQEGWREVAGNNVTLLEPYSALAAANPAVYSRTESEAAALYRKWLKASRDDIEANNRASFDLALAMPARVAFYDLVYAPPESVFLRHGRYSGHRTLNGKAMIIAQAAQALVHRIGHDVLAQAGRGSPELYRQVLETMFRAW